MPQNVQIAKFRGKRPWTDPMCMALVDRRLHNTLGRDMHRTWPIGISQIPMEDEINLRDRNNVQVHDVADRPGRDHLNKILFLLAPRSR